ncbi:hypothetical protein EVAR_38555_1 [Eumeta japonica]|uniref:Uncharacterized protein n=1 Tax=Eumeta variegata TaxID=151549 RepID=A0A4C1WUM1_EUMVA|nr:hypothetical protein EVAR_38555_1 [Eumeta japonica]
MKNETQEYKAPCRAFNHVMHALQRVRRPPTPSSEGAARGARSSPFTSRKQTEQKRQKATNHKVLIVHHGARPGGRVKGTPRCEAEISLHASPTDCSAEGLRQCEERSLFVLACRPVP